MDHTVDRGRILDIESQFEVGATRHVELFQCRNVSGQYSTIMLTDRALAQTSDHTVVIQYDFTVTGDPCVTFQACCPQSTGQKERFDGVFAGVRPRAAMGEANGW